MRLSAFGIFCRGFEFPDLDVWTFERNPFIALNRHRHRYAILEGSIIGRPLFNAGFLRLALSRTSFLPVRLKLIPETNFDFQFRDKQSVGCTMKFISVTSICK